MKIEKILIQGLDKELTFVIGKNKSENFEVIDMGSDNDLWFHANDISSCHVVCLLSDTDVDKKDMRYVIKAGALLCKNNTNKLKSMKNVEIIYTQIKNITKTDIEGCVLTQNSKSIVC